FVIVGGTAPEEADQALDGSGLVAIPGLIQTHLHLCQTLFRSLADDVALLDWLQRFIWPLEAAHTPETLYASAALGVAELLKGGTTAILDMATLRHTGAIFEACRDLGIRATIGKVLMDHPRSPEILRDTTASALDESVQLLQRWHNREDGRLRYAFAPRFAVSCTDTLLREVADLARRYNVRVHTHASENRDEVAIVEAEHGLRNIAYLDSIGLSGPHVCVAHCVHVDQHEIELLARTGTHVLHCPSSNCKLASGIAPIPEMLAQGVHVSLGADGAACNNNLDAFQEMRLAALIHKPRFGPQAMPAQDVLRLATIGGAAALGLDDQIGSIEVGKQADLVLLDLGQAHVQPASDHNLISRIVYAARAGDVRHVFVGGRQVVRDGALLADDEARIVSQANQALRHMTQTIG
ncbi:MAG: 5'-deoxyadenosine deaminase, partial [Chloroflexi bacterium]|nr:5'-deoxyadenosine deaminase [Chloroflexota bacterium]